jgi:hypothetical protein
VEKRTLTYRPSISRQLTWLIISAQTTSPSAKETFTHLAETWERLAAELESAQTFLKAMAAADPKKFSDAPVVVDRSKASHRHRG